MRVSPGKMAKGTRRKGWKPERLGRKNLASSTTWLLVACGRLGSQDDSEIKWPGEKLVPFSEKVNPGPSCYTRARGPLPSAPSLHPTQPSSRAFSLPFRQRWEPDPATPVTSPQPGGDSPGGEGALHSSLLMTLPTEAWVVCFPVTPPEMRPGTRGPVLGCKAMPRCFRCS